MSKKGFTIICDNCGYKQKIFDNEAYFYEKDIVVDFGPVAEDGADIICTKCEQKIIINKF